MDSLPSVALLMFVATITPGPNNLIVLRTAAMGGVRAALPGIAGIVLGGLVLLGVVWGGLDESMRRWPWLRTGLLLAGAGWLIWAGLRMAFAAPPPANAKTSISAPCSLTGLLCFQLVNPKSWTLVLTVVASVVPSAQSGAAHALLPLLFVFVPLPCLLAWALAGDAASRWLDAPITRARFDRVMGMLLAGSALGLLLPLHEGLST